MASFRLLVGVYLLGGLTFIPLALALVFLHAYLTLPQAQQPRPPSTEDALSGIDDAVLKEKLAQRAHEPEVAAGYFAVCREYVPGGVNGKPPERTTPAGETIATESPSVYQSIYRSVFERNKSQTPTLEAGKNVKKARNVFYVVLRHGHLVLFDNAEQLEVRHVIALALYDVDLYAGGEFIPEGELFIKRNCIRLSQKITSTPDAAPARPFYLFGENCSAKEDMYFSILHNQQRYASGSKSLPSPRPFETEDMISLIRQLHLSDSAQHGRWLNAALGRIFLGVYKTPDLEGIIRQKLNKKISRVPKPAFITSLKLGDIDLGSSAPLFSNMRLKECTVDGDLTVEADIRYSGQLRLVIGAVARIELGSRLKPREVEMLLAGTVRLLDGHMLFRIKPPPSNRIWFSFETMPKLELTIEPIVSARQITYGIILRAIESRIREVLAETLVQPFWDDVPFFNTAGSDFRGGIWKFDDEGQAKPDEERRHSVPAEPSQALGPESVELVDQDLPSETSSTFTADDLGTPQRANSLPAFVEEDKFVPNGEIKGSGSSAEKPKALRANSFATAASPVVSTGTARVPLHLNQVRKRQKDAASNLKSLSTQSPDPSPVTTPVADPSSPILKGRSNSLEQNASPTLRAHRRASSGPSTGISLGSRALDSSPPPPLPILDDMEHISASDAALTAALQAAQASRSVQNPRHDRKSSTASSKEREAAAAERAEQRRAALNQTLQTIGTATNAARNWGMGVVQRQMEARREAQLVSKQTAARTQMEPMGRGQPLPPPGQPLPRPSKDTWSSMAFNSLRKKPNANNIGRSPSHTPPNDNAIAGLTSSSSVKNASDEGLTHSDNSSLRKEEAADAEPGSLRLEVPAHDTSLTPSDHDLSPDPPDRDEGVFEDSVGPTSSHPIRSTRSREDLGPTEQASEGNRARQPKSGEALRSKPHASREHLKLKQPASREDLMAVPMSRDASKRSQASLEFTPEGQSSEDSRSSSSAFDPKSLVQPQPAFMRRESSN